MTPLREIQVLAAVLSYAYSNVEDLNAALYSGPNQIYARIGNSIQPVDSITEDEVALLRDNLGLRLEFLLNADLDHQDLLTQVKAWVEEKRAAGWTRAHFAAGLAEMLGISDDSVGSILGTIEGAAAVEELLDSCDDTGCDGLICADIKAYRKLRQVFHDKTGRLVGPEVDEEEEEES